MLKKRIIFTLLYDDGYFVLSRNFRLQRVGNLEWLKKNYNFSHIAFYIDELIVLDVSRNNRSIENFSTMLKELSAECLVPIAAGGGINTLSDAKKMLRSGADKLVINTALFKNINLVKELCEEYGKQCIVGSFDVKILNNKIEFFVMNGTEKIDSSINDPFNSLPTEFLGEMYLNSIERDGTGQGYDFKILDYIPSYIKIPVIMSGGVGNYKHLIEGINHQRIDAASTAHLFNFIGDGLFRARESLLSQGVELAYWPDISSLTLNE